MASIDKRPGTLRIWFTALRPFSFTVSVLPLMLGTILAGYAGYDIFWWRVCLLVLAVIFFHAAANLFNDDVDYARGVDEEIHPVSGAVVRGWLSGHQVRKAAMILMCMGVGLAAMVIWLSGWVLLWMVLAGISLALGYTRSGICLKYMGLGDPAILLAFGILPVLAGWWTSAGTFSLLPVWWSIPSGLLAVAILHANNWRDRQHDATKGCRTLAVRMGPRGCRIYWQGLLLLPTLMIVGAFLLQLFLQSDEHVPLGTLGTLLLLPALLRLVWVDWSSKPDQIVELDARAARFHCGFTLLLCLGFLLDWWMR